jgi:phosphonoacetaldehyde hydrolase
MSSITLKLSRSAVYVLKKPFALSTSSLFSKPNVNFANFNLVKRSYVKHLYEDEFFGGAFTQDVSSNASLVDGNVFTNKRLEYGTKRFYRGKVKAAIFDWGGTVVDCGVCAPILTYVELFKQVGVDITEDEARGPMGASSRIHIGKIMEKEAVVRRWKEANGAEPTEEDVDRMVDKFIPQVLSSLQKYSNVIDGVSETISLLRKSPYDLKIGSTTGYPKRVLDVLLNTSSSQGFSPDASACLSEIPHDMKPSPFMLWTCAVRLGVMPIEAIVKIDDSVNGISEGLSAGCWTIGIAMTSSYVGLTEAQLEEVEKDELRRRMNRAYKHLTNSGAHYVIDTIRELPMVINDINRRLATGEKP